MYLKNTPQNRRKNDHVHVSTKSKRKINIQTLFGDVWILLKMVIFHPFFDVAFLLYHFLMVFQTSHPSHHQALKKPRNWTSASATACNCDRTRPSGRLIIPKPCGFLQFFLGKSTTQKGKLKNKVQSFWSWTSLNFAGGTSHM